MHAIHDDDLTPSRTFVTLLCTAFIFRLLVLFLLGALCADTLQSHQDEFAPFCELSDDISTFDDYVQRVRDSAEWGGHLELRALGMALDRPIHIFKAGTGEPLHIHEQGSGEPIRLSYHHHYYALGEHYNQVVPCTEVPQE